MSSFNYPEKIQYTMEHVWLADNGDGAANIGITDYAQDQLGDVIYVDLPDVGAIFEAGTSFGTVESVKTVSELYMPVTGSVLAVNQDLESTPALVNTVPYAEGWMIRIRPADGANTSRLISATEYRLGLKSQI
ncbi:MAG: glycine cleavage system protein GcvH [Deltaproteobacteria bacterium]|nr:glycine cleavage system protein GcvH [Deltaproteobacteria bacterium]